MESYSLKLLLDSFSSFAGGLASPSRTCVGSSKRTASTLSRPEMSHSYPYCRRRSSKARVCHGFLSPDRIVHGAHGK